MEAIRRNSKLAHRSRRWHDLHERIRSSPYRSLQSDPDTSPPRSRRFLTPDDIAEIVRVYEAGQSTQHIGSRYGMSKTRVATILREQGVPLRRPGLTDDQVSEAAQLYEAGKSLAILGVHFGVSHATIANVLKKRGIRLRPRPGWRDTSTLHGDSE